MENKIKNYISKNREDVFTLLKNLCAIPAPSHKEENRANYIKTWSENIGAKNAYIDDALNVIFPLNCENSNKITVFAAHTDTVFPDLTPMPYHDDETRIYSPGVADDTASVVVLMMMAKFFIENNIIPENGIIFVCNSCEEGLGNLKGTRKLFENYKDKIARFITFDSNLNVVADRCVGSHRFEVEVQTTGGHSFLDFGKENAIKVLSEIVTEIYRTEIPKKPGKTATYNVGTIAGGTSVNTIAQNAKMLCEYRSDDSELLEIMRKRFEEIFSANYGEDVKINVTTVGERPCSITPENEIESLEKKIVPIIESVIHEKVIFESSSTDCNIPLSLGVPALCIGTNTHNGIHTREEWVDKDSILKGLEIAIKLGIAFTEV